MGADFYDDLHRALLERIEASTADLGSETSANGARLFGHVPHVAPEAWLHIVFPIVPGAA